MPTVLYVISYNAHVANAIKGNLRQSTGTDERVIKTTGVNQAEC